jgi:hypothetical protein
VRNLERAGVPRSAAMKMVGHKTEAMYREAMYRRYAIADESMLREGTVKLEALFAAQRGALRVVVPRQTRPQPAPAQHEEARSPSAA